MADLMTASAAFDELEKKYGNFAAPGCEVLANGKNVIEGLRLGLASLSMELTAEAQSSVCDVTVLGGYDVKKRAFKQDLIDAFTPGTAVEVKLGYIKKETVFKGFVWSQKLCNHEGDAAALRICCMDARRLMMENFTRKHYLKMSVSGIVSEILGNYSASLTGGTQVDAPSAKLEMVTQNGSDHDFLCELAERTGREFSVFAGKGYFAKRSKSPCVTLEMGAHIRHFEIERIYRNIAVEVYSPTGLTVANGKNDEATRDWQKSAGSAAVIAVPWPETDADTCKVMAQSLYDRRMDAAAGGLVRTAGLPELVPGRYLKLSKVGGGYDGAYFIRTVRHTIDESGFVTECELGGGA